MPPMPPALIPRHDTVALAAAISRAEVTAEAVVTDALNTAQSLQAGNILCAVAADAARTAAHAADRRVGQGGDLPPLLGVPFVVKDNIDCLGSPTSCANAALAANMPTRTAPVIRRLLDAGAILLGKANLHELASGVTGLYPSAPERNILNPHDPTRMAGGSSAGNAAAIAGGIVPFGIGTDTGGSLRIPAACCGVTGFRPSCHVPSGSVRYNREGIFPVSPRHDTPGPMARSVRDIIVLDRVLCGRAPAPMPTARLPRRIGLPTVFWKDADPAMALPAKRVARALERQGSTLVSADMPDLMALNQRVSPVINVHDPVQAIPAYFAENGHDGPTLAQIYASIQDPCAKALFAASLQPHDRAAYDRAITHDGPALTMMIAHFMDRHGLDVLLYPTLVLPPWRVGVPMPDTVQVGTARTSLFAAYIHNTTPISSAGMPAITLPLPMQGGPPAGVELCARVGADDHLLATALTVEAAARAA
ncbi:hypothetical protein CFR78_11810 [Komagataeibacter rhaeticus]|nr:hypothetical protein CFR78_11810 [Komagataeibacter rhaeticus]